MKADAYVSADKNTYITRHICEPKDKQQYVGVTYLLHGSVALHVSSEQALEHSNTPFIMAHITGVMIHIANITLTHLQDDKANMLDNRERWHCIFFEE